MDVDEQEGRQWLTAVSYYRLSGYFYPCRETDPDRAGQRLDRFRSGTRFSDVIALYEADRKLRTLIHDGLERVEIACRAQISSLLSRPDALSYRDSSSYRPGFRLANWLGTAEKRVDRARRHNGAIKHYDAEYGGQYPLWVLAEVLDFSDVSRLYEGLRFEDQQDIASQLGIGIDLSQLTSALRRKARRKHPLANWLEQLTVLRNFSARHARVWNQTFVPVPTNALRILPGLESLPLGQSERVYGMLLVIDHLLRVFSPGSSWGARARELVMNDFLTNPIASAAALGVPEDSPWRGAPVSSE